jgi:hypothetical protein
MGARLPRAIFAPFQSSGSLGFPAVRSGAVFERSQAAAQLGEESGVRRFVDALELVGVDLEIVQFLLAIFRT